MFHLVSVQRGEAGRVLPAWAGGRARGLPLLPPGPSLQLYTRYELQNKNMSLLTLQGDPARRSHTAKKFRVIYSQKTNCGASVPIATFMCGCERFIYSHGLVCLFSCSRIGRPIRGNISIAHGNISVFAVCSALCNITELTSASDPRIVLTE
jgi:hypothetical protein